MLGFVQTHNPENEKNEMGSIINTKVIIAGIFTIRTDTFIREGRISKRTPNQKNKSFHLRFKLLKS